MKQLIIAVLLITLAQNSLAEGLSRKEIETIADNYVEAWNHKKYASLSEMYLIPSSIGQSDFTKSCVLNTETRGEDDGHIIIEFDLADSRHQDGQYRESTWLLLTNDGKIKYDSLIQLHPLDAANDACRYIEAIFGESRTSEKDPSLKQEAFRHYEILENTGVPLFGLNLDGSQEDDEISDSIDEIKDWIKDHIDSWDKDEPMVYLPRGMQKRIKLHMKAY